MRYENIPAPAFGPPLCQVKIQGISYFRRHWKNLFNICFFLTEADALRLPVNLIDGKGCYVRTPESHLQPDQRNSPVPES